MPNIAEGPQGPLNSPFPKGQSSLFGVHTFNVVGSGLFANRTVPPTGVPTGANSAGLPGMSATYQSTGIYALRFPIVKSIDMDAAVSSSSGYMYHAQVNNQSGPSGSAQLEITRLNSPGNASGFNPIQASGFLGFLPSGSKVMVQFYAAPTSDGLTSY